MAAILEIPEVRRRVSPLTVEEYHRLGEFNENGRRTELIRGIIIEKMSKSPLHRIVTSRLYRRLLVILSIGFSFWLVVAFPFVDCATFRVADCLALARFAFYLDKAQCFNVLPTSSDAVEALFLPRTKAVPELDCNQPTLRLPLSERRLMSPVVAKRKNW